MIRFALVFGLFSVLTASALGASIAGIGVASSYAEKIDVREGSRRRGRAGTFFFVSRRTVGGGGYRGGK